MQADKAELGTTLTQADSRSVPIPLPCGKTAYVSECDYHRVSRLSWSDRGSGYVRARFKRSAGGDGRFVYLHRFILSATNGLDVDHIDKNPLNNTRENLQVATRSRNIMRAYMDKSGISKQRNKWRARLRVDGKQLSLGCYDTEDAARKAVEDARRKAWDDDLVNDLGVVA